MEFRHLVGLNLVMSSYESVCGTNQNNVTLKLYFLLEAPILKCGPIRIANCFRSHFPHTLFDTNVD